MRRLTTTQVLVLEFIERWYDRRGRPPIVMTIEIRPVRPEEYAEAGGVTADAYREFVPPGDGDDWGGYPVEEAAVRHNASAQRETNDPHEAYARFPARQITRYRDGWLP